VAQPPGTPVRVGFLSAASPTGDTIHRAFVEGLREHGYTPGQNLVVESRWAEERFERLPELVMIGVADPVGAGLVTSLARPDGNVTGTSGAFTQIVGKQLGLLKETFPDVSRVTVLWNPANPVYQALQLREAQIAARTLRIELQLVETRTVGELEKVFAAVARRQPLLLMGDPLFTTHRQRISQLAAARRIPVVTGVERVCQGRRDADLRSKLSDLARRSAVYADKVIKGARPADLPVEERTTFQLVLNLRTARSLGVKLPQPLPLRADRVIE
jgi:putative ABC transport system substrate-binding protein